ncbi:MAG: phosphoglycolate phosphatase [Candidatus Bathyarchaeota archaeon B26-2]|nr:MAG: phosphoglycolate phosphatase [Candidatus Bathyarchaeota archaeon B26-2]
MNPTHGVFMSVRAVIFDLDETLIHSKIDFKKMKERVITFLESVGVTEGLLNTNMLNMEITRLAVEDLHRRGLSEEEIRSILAGVTKIMNRTELESLVGAKPIEGAKETLKALKERGLKIGVMTRSCHEYAERALTKFGLRAYVDAISARDDVEEPKPSPIHARHMMGLLGVKACETVLVGDHWLDGLCAKEAGLRCILVLRRNLNLEMLEGYDYRIARSIREITRMI